jgi:hypothetical protein
MSLIDKVADVIKRDRVRAANTGILEAGYLDILKFFRVKANGGFNTSLLTDKEFWNTCHPAYNLVNSSTGKFVRQINFAGWRSPCVGWGMKADGNLIFLSAWLKELADLGMDRPKLRLWRPRPP